MSKNFMGSNPSNGIPASSFSPTPDSRLEVDVRQQYRVALVKQLRAGLEVDRQIDLRDENHEVVVAFIDEPILPTWQELARNEAVLAHLFVAPADFESGALTMVSLTDGGTELSKDDLFVDAQCTFAELLTQLRWSYDRGASDVIRRRLNVIDAPSSVYHDGLAYSFAFSELIDV